MPRLFTAITFVVPFALALVSLPENAVADELSDGLAHYEEMEYGLAVPKLVAASKDTALSGEQRARALLHLGIIYVSEGRRAAAREALRSAVRLDSMIALSEHDSPRLIEMLEFAKVYVERELKAAAAAAEADPAPKPQPASGLATPQSSQVPAVASDPVPPAPPWWQHSSLLRWGGAGLGAIGASLVIGGAALGADAENIRVGTQPGGVFTQPEAVERQERANRMAGDANILLGVGLGSLIVGGVAILWDRINVPESAVTTVVADAVACVADDECSSEQVCHQNRCSYLQVVEKEVGTFQIVGRVSNAVTGEPIGDALVTFGRVRSSPLSTAPGTGEFESYPLPSGNGAVRVSVSADGYDPSEAVVPRGKKDVQVEVNLRLNPTGHVVTGSLRGTVRDARSGAPVVAKIFVASVSKTVLGKGGTFELLLPPGNHEVLVTAKNYTTQRKRFTIHAGVEVVFNVDLQPVR